MWGAAALAGVGNAGGLILFYRAAAIGPLSIVAPVGALAAVGPVVVGVAEGEGLAPAKVAGLCSRSAASALAATAAAGRRRWRHGGGAGAGRAARGARSPPRASACS